MDRAREGGGWERGVWGGNGGERGGKGRGKVVKKEPGINPMACIH